MGYRLQETIATLVFEGAEYGGLEVRCSLGLSLGDEFEFQGALAGIRAGDATAEAIAGAREAFRRWGDTVLRSWNIQQEDGTPIPATGAGMLAIPSVLATEILRAYTRTAAGELPTTSAGG